MGSGLGALVLMVSFAVLGSCSGQNVLESGKVDQDSIWARYRLDSDLDSQKVTFSAQFRLGSENGAVVKLSDASFIAVDGQNMGLAENGAQELGIQGNSYLLSLSSMSQANNQANSQTNNVDSFSFLWTRTDGKKVSNVVPVLTVPSLRKNDIVLKNTRRAALRLPLDGWNEASKEASISCVLESMAPPEDAAELASREGASVGGAPSGTSGSQSGWQPGVGAVIGSPVATPTPVPAGNGTTAGAQQKIGTTRSLVAVAPRGSDCVFPSEKLADFVMGSARVRVIAEKTDSSVQGHPKGGLLSSRTLGNIFYLEVSE